MLIVNVTRAHIKARLQYAINKHNYDENMTLDLVKKKKMRERKKREKQDKIESLLFSQSTFEEFD